MHIEKYEKNTNNLHNYRKRSHSTPRQPKMKHQKKVFIHLIWINAGKSLTL